MIPRSALPLFIASALVLGCRAARAADPAAPAPGVQQVVVTADHPEVAEKSYRRLLKAMVVFEDWRRDHPDAVLRLRVYARKDGVDLAKLRMYLLDPETGERTPVPVEADDGFTVPRVESLREHDAVLRTNLPPGDLAWRFQVVRDGVDPRHRVLGDIREECRLEVATGALARTVVPPPFALMRAAGVDLCMLTASHWDSIAERPVFAVHFTAGERRASLPSQRLHLETTPSMMAPLGDGTYALRDRDWTAHDGGDGDDWPDDTQVDIVYADDATPAPMPIPIPETVSDLLAPIPQSVPTPPSPEASR